MIALTLILAAAPPCADLDASVARLHSDDYLLAAAEAKTALGYPLLRGAETDLPTAEQQLLAAARLRSACALDAAATPAPTGSGDRLTEILDRPEFARARDRNPQAFYQWLRRAMEWLEELLGQKPAQAFASGVRMLVLLLAGIAVALTAWRLSRSRRRRSASPSFRPTTEALVLLDPLVHLKNARSLAATDPRAALREALLALLSELERRRLARPDRVKTNRELSEELPQRGASEEIATTVRDLLRGYDRAFYSLDPVSPEVAAHFADQVEQLRSSLDAR